MTIDPDTEILLREEMERTGKPFKRVLNEAVRSALGKRGTPVEIKALFRKPFPVGLADANFNQLADAWDDDETVRELNP